MGTRALLAIPLATPWVRAPTVPYTYADLSQQGRETRLDTQSLARLRWVCALLAAIGAGLLAYRFRWAGTIAIAIVLLLPRNAENFARAWAEGPVLLAIGAIAAAYGSRAFPLMLGVASTVKFTVVGLWPLLALRSARAWKSRLLALCCTVAVWVADSAQLVPGRSRSTLNTRQGAGSRVQRGPKQCWKRPLSTR